MDPDEYFSGYNLKMEEGNKSLGMLKMCNLDGNFFTLSPVAYITVDFKKLIGDLFHAGSAFVESEFIKRKTRLPE